MIKLINETEPHHEPFTAVRRIEMHIQDEASLDEMQDAYRQFLLCCGYQVRCEECEMPYPDHKMDCSNR